MTEHGTDGDTPSTGRSSGPADSVAGQLRPPRFVEDLGIKLGHALGGEIDRTIRNRHRRHLRRVGQEHALDASTFDFAKGTPARDGNTIEVLIDGTKKPAIVRRHWDLRDLGRGYTPEILGAEADDTL